MRRGSHRCVDWRCVSRCALRELRRRLRQICRTNFRPVKCFKFKSRKRKSPNQTRKVRQRCQIKTLHPCRSKRFGCGRIASTSRLRPRKRTRATGACLDARQKGATPLSNQSLRKSLHRRPRRGNLDRKGSRRLVWNRRGRNSAPVPMSLSVAQSMAISAPLPEYPYEAKRRNLTGNGICIVSVEVATGRVTDAKMSKSTGSAMLDKLTVQTFKSWRFKPGTVSPVRVPISYE